MSTSVGSPQRRDEAGELRGEKKSVGGGRHGVGDFLGDAGVDKSVVIPLGIKERRGDEGRKKKARCSGVWW